MKLLNSSQPIVEPLNTRKSARFSLQYIDNEDKPDGEEQWEPRFAGHQSLQEREASFFVQDKKIHCGFVKAPKGSPTTGFDLTEDDTNYISRCHIAVISCIFGNSDRLRPPANKMVLFPPSYLYVVWPSDFLRLKFVSVTSEFCIIIGVYRAYIEPKF